MTAVLKKENVTQHRPKKRKTTNRFASVPCKFQMKAKKASIAHSVLNILKSNIVLFVQDIIMIRQFWTDEHMHSARADGVQMDSLSVDVHLLRSLHNFCSHWTNTRGVH